MYNTQEKWFIALFGWIGTFFYKMVLYVIVVILFIVAPITIAYKNVIKKFNKLDK